MGDALRYHREGHFAEAERRYLLVLDTQPRHAACLHLLGLIALQTGRPSLAAERFLRAIAIDGRIAAYHAGLGNALRAMGRPADAADCYSQAIRLESGSMEAWHNLGLVLRALGRPADAIAAYRRTLVLAPGLSAIHHNLGLALSAASDWAGAAKSFLRAAHLSPSSPEALYNLGNALAASNRRRDAVLCYRRALLLDPGHFGVLVNLGNLLAESGRTEDALTSFLRASRLAPQAAEAYNNLGNVLRETGRSDAALVAYRTVLAVAPDFGKGHYNLGLSLRERGEQEPALRSFGRALLLDPDHAECRLVRTMASLPVLAETPASSVAATMSFDRALDDLAAWADGRAVPLGNALGAGQPFFLAYRPVDHCERLSRFGDLAAFAAEARWRAAGTGAAPARPNGRRVRIGIVGGHFRRHPVWDLMVHGIVDALDRRRFELFLYHTKGDGDDETTWAASQADHFEPGPKPVATWLEILRRDQPDILFYPEIGMDPASFTLACLRLAPVQAVSWGHPITSGLPTIDLFFSGALLEPSGGERHYREKLIRLPGTGVCTKVLDGEPEPVDPASLGLPGDRTIVRFALCQTPFKFDPASDHLYAKIAKGAGPCQFWIWRDAKYQWASDRLRDRLAGAFLAEGLDPDEHLRMMPWLSRRKFASVLDQMDIYLDCPAFSGYTTAWQAAHRGVPIVTLDGPLMRQRQASGLLRQIGLPEGAAPGEGAYVDLAIRWARECRETALWQARREVLRLASTLADDNRQAVRAFEEALLKTLGERAPGAS